LQLGEPPLAVRANIEQIFTGVTGGAGIPPELVPLELEAADGLSETFSELINKRLHFVVQAPSGEYPPSADVLNRAPYPLALPYTPTGTTMGGEYFCTSPYFNSVRLTNSPHLTEISNRDLIKLTSERYKDINKLSPSLFATGSQFVPKLRKAEPATALYMLGRPIDSGRVPIALLSDVFARFEVNFHVGCEALYGPREFGATRELMTGLADLHPSEADLQSFVNYWLTTHFDVELQTTIGGENRRASDGHDVVIASGTHFLRMLSEGKWCFGGGSGDPVVQGMCYYREFYRQRAQGFPPRGGCKPALLLVYAGIFLRHCQTETGT
jgi:hypothetical protein